MNDGAEPVRKRRWLRQLLIGVAVFVLAAVGARLWWGYSAEKALRREIEAIRSRGETLNIADLAEPPLPDSENAVEFYRQAVAVVLQYGTVEFPQEDPPPERNAIISLLAYPEFRRRHPAETAKLLEACAEALKLSRQARALKQSDWKLSYSGPAINITLPPLSDYKQLACLLCVAATTVHEAGRDAEAIEYVRDTLRLGRSTGGPPVLICYLVEVSIERAALLKLEEMMPDLQVAARPPAATAEQLRALVEELLAEEAPLRERLVRAMMGERCIVYDTAERIRSGELSLASLGSVGGQQRAPMGEWVGLSLFGPVLTRDEARAIRYMGSYVEAARKQTWPEARRSMAPHPGRSEEPTVLSTVAHIISFNLLPTMDRAFLLHQRHVTMRRMTALALAIRLYQTDHGGKRPANLQELVPSYLPALPQEPFAEDGRSFCYLPKTRPALLYSVYENGEDDGGSFQLRREGNVDLDASADLVFFLDGDRPHPRAPEPATSIAPASR